MKTAQYLTQDELRRCVAQWMLENSVTAFVPLGGSKSDYIDSFVMPDVVYAHFDSCADENGDLITLLKAHIDLKPTASRSGKAEKIVFFKVLRTYISTPDVAPEEVGYILS